MEQVLDGIPDGWFTTTYDTFDTTFDDEIFQMDGSTEVFNLSLPLANGIVYNVYLNGVRIDDPKLWHIQSKQMKML